MAIWQESLLIGLVLGTVLALFVIPRSIKKEPIYGGLPSQVLHVIGAVLFSAVLPTVIVTLIRHGGFGTAFPLAIGLVALAYVVLCVFAVIELPAKAKNQPAEEVWTEEKARASGM